MISTLLATATPAGADPIAAAVAAIGFLLVVVVLAAFYFTPSIIAFVRKRPNAVPIAVLNFFLGWSLIGWVVSLVWALSSDQPIHQVIVSQVAPAAPISAGAGDQMPA